MSAIIQIPDSNGEIIVNLPLTPVSQQANGAQKSIFGDKIRAQTLKYGHLLTGDVSLTVEWMVSEQERYEHDRSPDIDNVLKPLIDSMVGPNGIMIDDNQVQHISIYWIDSYSAQQSLTITAKFHQEEFIPKGKLFFVQFQDGLCWPMDGTHSWSIIDHLVDAILNLITARNELVRLGAARDEAKGVMPLQRPFHRTRIHGFKVIKLEDYLAERKARTLGLINNST